MQRRPRSTGRAGPATAALEALQPVEGTTDCPAGNGLESAPLCWVATVTEPLAASRTAAALRTAGATGVLARCGALGPQAIVRCEITGQLKGHGLDLAVVHQGSEIVVFGYPTDGPIPSLVSSASPVPVPS